MNMLLILLTLGVSQAKVLDSKGNHQCGDNNKYCHPEQVHIAFGEKNNDIKISWATYNNTEQNLVEYGEEKLDLNVTGEQKLFIDDGPLKLKVWVHNALLKDLKFNTTYKYRVGSQFGWSEEFSFKTPPAGKDWAVSAVIFGDLGIDNGISLPFIIEDVANGNYDFVLHVGDIAYNLYVNNGEYCNMYLRSIEPMAANIPYMVCPGNHEGKYNFSHYRKRFSMPGTAENMFYSWDIGPIHFVSINTEAYYDDFGTDHSKEIIQIQYEWLQNHLAEANRPENRQKHPWLILYGHRPMMCSSSNEWDECRGAEYAHRVGIPELGGYGLEVLLKEHVVDIAIWAHEHNYERMWPVYNKTVYNGSYEQPYVNPRAPVHFTSGSAGCDEKTDHFYPDPYEWSAFRSPDYGYTRFYAYNDSHIHIEQFSTQHVENNRRGEVRNSPKKIDSFWVVKDHRKPYDI